ncbi:MAG: peptide deformylase [Dehalococcoidia bacterium]
MAVLPIRMAGDPVLRQKAKKVSKIDDSIQKLIDDMIETMRDAPGVGLAANQVGVPLRVIVMEIPELDDREQPRRDLYVLINPQIVKRSGERRLDEGCLSIPGYHAEVPRSVNVSVKGLNREGKEVRIKAEDNLLAEAIEHEVDHTNGILYIDHLESMDELVKVGDDEEEAEAEEGEQEVEAPSARGRS